MPRHVVLLRGINLARRNRISMPELRAALTAAGFRDVLTYLQSGNVLVSTRASPDRVAAQVRRVVKTRFGLEIAVLVSRWRASRPIGRIDAPQQGGWRNW